MAVGETRARRLEDFHALGRHPVRSIPNGVPDIPLTPRRRDGAGPIFIGVVGRLDAMTGHDVLLRAVSRLSNTRVVIVGEGDERSRLDRLTLELGIRDGVSLPGWDDAPRERLSGFDVFALPSRAEGFPLALLEAMFAGLPLAASRVGSVAEAVTDGESALLRRIWRRRRVDQGAGAIARRPIAATEVGNKCLHNSGERAHRRADGRGLPKTVEGGGGTSAGVAAAGSRT